MDFLHKLWDETVAGPPPETGLGKLRKYDSFSATRSPPMVQDEVAITRSITILKNNSNFRNFLADPSSASESPAELASTPRTPLTPRTPAGQDFKKVKRRTKSSAEALEPTEPRSPTAYDWIMITSLDR